MDTPTKAENAVEGFDYFVVRLTRHAGRPCSLTGLVERLGSGEKRPFDTAEQLAVVMSGWSAAIRPTPSGDAP